MNQSKDKITNKHLKSVQNYIITKRIEIQTKNSHQQSMLDSIRGGFQNLGVSSVKVGSDTVEIQDQDFSLTISKDDKYWTDEINKGNPLFILSVNTNFIGYHGKENAEFNNQEISDLIDEELVKTYAPTAIVYAPNDTLPWQEVISSNSFNIFISNQIEFDNLWKNIDNWVKTNWHDNITQSLNYNHQAKDVFRITLIHEISNNLSWRILQYKKSQRDYSKLYNLGQWDTVAQCELKKTLTALVHLENHPIFGSKIQQIMEEISPLLIDSMEGKEKTNIAKKNVEQMREKVYEGFKSKNIEWKDRKKFPI